jgi:hypothetical protein
MMMKLQYVSSIHCILPSFFRFLFLLSHSSLFFAVFVLLPFSLLTTLQAPKFVLDEKGTAKESEEDRQKTIQAKLEEAKVCF